MLISSIVLFLAAILFIGFFLFLSSLAMAQVQQQQQTASTTMTTTPPSSSLSITTIPPLTPQEQEQQNRLQNLIAATTRDLNETEKQVSGIVYTPRWSEPVWINASSIAVLVAYCLPGEFADSGQEILGGFELEVLESYAVALPQGFMAWMAVVGNEDNDVQNGRRLPAALGAICASDLNNTDTRILSPQERQQINNINQQFTAIQNTQITNIDQVINIINNVTEPPTTEEQPLRAEIITNATTLFDAAFVKLDADVTGGTPPYNYHWRWVGHYEGSNRSFIPFIQVIGTHLFILNVTDSRNQTASDSVEVTIKERTPTNDTGTSTGEPLRVEAIANPTQAFVRHEGVINLETATIRFDSNVTGGTPPYDIEWQASVVLDNPIFLEGVEAGDELNLGGWGNQPSFIVNTLSHPGKYTFIATVTDSRGQTSTDNVQITLIERPPEGGGVLLPPETGQEGQPPGALLPGIAPGGEEQQPRVPPPPPPPIDNGEGVSPPPPEGEEGGGTPPSSPTEEEESPPPPDNTGDEGDGGGESPRSDEEPTNPAG
jgi:hypothetical protein